MDRELKKYLGDIIDQIKFLEEITAQPLQFSEFEKLLLLLRSVERAFEIIGEAVKRSLKINPT